MIHRRKAIEDYSANFRRCSACGFHVKLGRHPSGGQFVPPSIVDSVVGSKTYYDLATNDAGQGCPACGSPAWASGGKLGALAIRH